MADYEPNKWPTLERYASMAMFARGKSFANWPAWSTGETLIVALVLNNHTALKAMNYTIVEALDRVDLTVAELRAIERAIKR